MPLRTLFNDTSSIDDESFAIASFSDGDGDGPLAQSFSSGANPITLTSIQLVLDDGTPSDGGTISIDLFSNSAGQPNTEVATLGTIDDSSLNANPDTYTVSIGSSPTLTANTTYWIELQTSDSSNALWEATDSPTGTGTSGQAAYFDGGTENGFDFLMNLEGSFCFAAGTRILAAHGETPVEHLRPGDRVLALLAGRLAPIRWIGHRQLDLRTQPQPENVNPVRIRAHAFGPNRPHADLVLSPNHSLYIDGSLIAARYLVNGATIVQEPRQNIHYYHIELDTHDILLAENLAAESFLDVGNRAAFTNGGRAVDLHPDFAETIWAANACAPAMDKFAALTRLRETLLARAQELGHVTTTDPDLRVFANGRLLKPSAETGHVRYDLPPATEEIRLISRAASPNEMRAEQSDGRRLGLGIAAIALDDQPLALDSARLTKGWHEPEPTLRWTNGDARLQTTGARTLSLTLCPGMTYWAAPEAARAATA